VPREEVKRSGDGRLESVIVDLDHALLLLVLFNDLKDGIRSDLFTGVEDEVLQAVEALNSDAARN